MLKKIKKNIIYITCFLANFIAFSQTENLNFEFGNFDNWILDTGVRTNSTDINWNIRPADDVGLHIKLTSPASQAFDKFGLNCFPTTLKIPTVFVEGQFSARIGNLEGENKAARLSHSFTVKANKTFLQYNYAIVLEDPGHSDEEQPKFIVNIKNATGNIIDCGQFETSAGTNAVEEGFINCGKYQFLPWNTGGIDLTAFIGQQITIEFIALDCTLGQHGGYAYVEADLKPLKIKVEDFCKNGDNITLTAPLGFSEYMWNNGESTRSITVTNAKFGERYNVELFSNTGCLSSISIVLAPIPRATIKTIPDEDICLGGNTIVFPTGENVGDYRYTRPDPTNPKEFIDAAPNGISAVLNPTKQTTYTVIARDEYGCDGPSTTFTINVIDSDKTPFPKADFKIDPVLSASNDNPCNTIQLTNLSGYCKGGLSYLWDFGDNTTSTEENPVHAFPNTTTSKTYIITLTVTSEDGLKNITSLEHSSSIIAKFSTSPPDCEIITLRNTSRICGASINDFPSYIYTWDFGDGSPNVTTNNKELSVTHTYTTSGTYTITLNITNPNNPNLNIQSYTDTVDISVETIVDFNYSINCFDVIFEDNSKPCNLIEGYSWNFGDGSPISNKTKPIHTYSTKGPHSVTLTLNDGTQNFTKTHNITLNPTVTTHDFDFEIDCTTVRFKDLTNSCKKFTYLWDFGDDTPINTKQNPNHTYIPNNTYTVTLTLNDGIKNINITKPITIGKHFVYVPPQDLILCSNSNTPDVATFDLTTQQDYILQNVDKTILEIPVVSFHTNSNNALANFNALPLDFTNTTNPQNLYARVEDKNGCIQIFPISLTVYNAPTVNTINDISLCYLKENTVGYDLSQLNAGIFESIDQTNINLSYHLFEDDAIARSNDVTQINLNSGLNVTIYVRAENTLNSNCFSLSTFSIRMDNENTDTNNRCMPFFANTMTPNGDGVNDAFFIKNIDTFPNNKLTIYNRWGNIVYETTGYNNNWYGTHKGKPLPVGNYYYYIDLNDNTNRSHSGYITILR